MVLRDRKEEFLNKANKPKFTSPGYEEPCIDANGKFILEYLNKVGDTNKKFDLLEDKISQVLSVQSAILEFSETDAGLYHLYDDIKVMISELVNKIQALEKSFRPETFTGSSTELRICNTQLVTLKKRIATFITRYYSIQEEYQSKCKARVKRQAQIAGADISKIDFDEAIGFKTDVFMQTVFPDFDMAHHYLYEIKKRHEDFLKLEKSIVELHELFFDLALVVQVDFALMDRIDKHSTFVDKLVIQSLNNVKSYRGSVRTHKIKRYLILGCIIFAVAIVMLVIYMIVK